MHISKVVYYWLIQKLLHKTDCLIIKLCYSVQSRSRSNILTAKLSFNEQQFVCNLSIIGLISMFHPECVYLLYFWITVLVFLSKRQTFLKMVTCYTKSS